MSVAKRISDAALAECYLEHQSVYKAAEKLGLAHQTVHERLVRLGVQCVGGGRPWSADDDSTLLRTYLMYRDAGRLDALAAEMGRTKHFICRQARRLGLTNQRHEKLYAGKWKYMPAAVAEGLWEQFKRSRLGLGQWCRSKGVDDLSFSRTMKGLFADEWEHVIELKAPKQSMYRLGRGFEYRVRDHLRRIGYVALRSPASKSPLDLAAIRPGRVLFVQCKRSGVVGVGEWNDFLRLSLSAGAEPIVAMMRGGSGIRYMQIVGEKDGTKRAQPWVEATP